MSELLDGLSQMFFELKVVSIVTNPKAAVLVFSTGCAIVGAVAVALDISFYLLRGQSLLKLKHGIRSSSIFLFSWSFGAFLMGWVGQLVNLFQVSVASCVFVGFAWPIFFTQILKKASDIQSQSEPVQRVISGE